MLRDDGLFGERGKGKSFTSLKAEGFAAFQQRGFHRQHLNHWKKASPQWQTSPVRIEGHAAHEDAPFAVFLCREGYLIAIFTKEGSIVVRKVSGQVFPAVDVFQRDLAGGRLQFVPEKMLVIENAFLAFLVCEAFIPYVDERRRRA